MHEILDHLPEGARVLDLGSQAGSFSRQYYSWLVVISADISRPPAADGRFVQADAASLPFRSHSFDAVILNHSVEHFVGLKPALQEIGRVVAPNGAVYVAVPDASAFSDRLYRKLFIGRGGHVNLFDSEASFAAMLEWYFGMRRAAGRTLFCGWGFLNRANNRSSIRLKQIRFGGLPERLAALFSLGLRLADRTFHTRLSVYGWALYFGNVGEPVDLRPRTNVCVRCGAGRLLEPGGRPALKALGLPAYRCTQCGAVNFFTCDNDF